MASEVTLWEWLAGVVPVGHFSRIETGLTCPGFPDVHYQLVKNISGTLELKYARNPRANIPFKNEKEGVHKSQRIWIRDNIRAGGTVWVVAQIGEEVLVIPGDFARRINGSTLDELVQMSVEILTIENTERAARVFHRLLLGD